MRFKLLIALLTLSIVTIAQERDLTISSPIKASCHNFLKSLSTVNPNFKRSDRLFKKLSKDIRNASDIQMKNCNCTDSLWTLLRRINYQQEDIIPTQLESETVLYYYEYPYKIDDVYLNREVVLNTGKLLADKLDYVIERAIRKSHIEPDQNSYAGIKAELNYISKHTKKQSQFLLSIIDDPHKDLCAKEIVLCSIKQDNAHYEHELLTRIDNPDLANARPIILRTISHIGSQSTAEYIMNKFVENTDDEETRSLYLISLRAYLLTDKVNNQWKRKIKKFLKEKA